MLEVFKKEETKYLIGVFLFVFVISIITPITGDDWGNYIVGASGFKNSIRSATEMYYTWEGRFISRIFLYFFTYHKFWWAFLNASQITTILYCAYKLIKPKNKITYILPILGMLLVNYDFYSQTYLWLAGNMTYLTPTALSMIVFTYLYTRKNYHLPTLTFIIFIILSFIIPMYVENIGCAYVFGILLWIIYIFYKEKRISIQLVVMLIVASLSLIIMLISPGSQIRLNLDFGFSNLNIFEKIFKNIPNFIYYVFTKNIFILIFMLIPIDIFINKKLTTKYKRIIIVLFNIISILSIIQNIIYMIPFNIADKIYIYNGIFMTNNWYFIIYWIIFGLLFLFSICHSIKNKDEKIKTLIIIITVVSSCLAMLVTPSWGDRVTVLCTLTLLFISIKLINNNLTIKNKYKSLIKIFFGITIACYSLVSIYNFIFEIRRTEHIKKAIDNNDEAIYLYTNHNYLLWNYNPYTEYHIMTYKMYRHIDKNVKVETVTSTINELYKYIVYGEYKS